MDKERCKADRANNQKMVVFLLSRCTSKRPAQCIQCTKDQEKLKVL